MPYLVNGQLVTAERIRAEEKRISRHPQWQSIGDGAERAKRVRAQAEFSAIDIILVEQIAASDPRPVDQVHIESQVQQQKALKNGRRPVDDRRLREIIEWNIGLQRTAREMIARSPKPSPSEIASFFNANRENFYGCAVFEAAHVVKHINESQSEEQARSGIELALAELTSGTTFAVVAERHSDCKGKGGDLGRFLAGAMVLEFEEAIRDLKPGERTGIFRTQFGFHIAELRHKTPAGPMAFEDVREDIERVLTRIAQHQEYLRLVAELRSRADIRHVPDAEDTKGREPEATFSASQRASATPML